MHFTTAPLLRHTAAALLLACALPLATAATLTVTVTGADGQPAPNTVLQWTPAPGTPGVAGTAAAALHAVQAAPVLISQRGSRFVPAVTAVPVGTVLRFSNEDPYDHHVRSQAGGPLGATPPAISFEMRLAGKTADKTSTAELRADAAGSVTLGCHIHSSMRGQLFIGTTPWLAVTDAKGQAQLADVPPGAGELKVWHADQLTEQPALRSTLAPTGGSVAATLNFAPRYRPGRG